MLKFRCDVETIVEKTYNLLHTKVLRQIKGREGQERDDIIQLIEELTINHDCCKSWIGGDVTSTRAQLIQSILNQRRARIPTLDIFILPTKNVVIPLVSKSKLKKFCVVKNNILSVYDKEDSLEVNQTYPIGKGGGYEMKNYKEDKKKATFDFVSPGNYVIKCETVNREDGPLWKRLLDPDNVLFERAECTNSDNPSSQSADPEIMDDYDDGNFINSNLKRTDDIEDNIYYDVQTVVTQPTEKKSHLTNPTTAQDEEESLREDDCENLYHAIYDSCCDAQDQLIFKRGDIIKIGKDYGEWLVGYMKGTYGLVPKSYLRPAYQRV
ncbi:DgyrCDS3561 [Dimorphilus gyrociliatus]|uniref:DgyrCDS3561 n=1 Tax=Dimorphilus gyrociliatus TaxID=2664684 RepID=A0A7I8VFH6_9ANNE|nr:DgyrCDS3561 [Dimorphilus gyrociliatus]